MLGRLMIAIICDETWDLANLTMFLRKEKNIMFHLCIFTSTH